MGRRWVLLAMVLVVLGAASAVAAVSRHDARDPKPAVVPAASQRGDDADLMRRLQRKKLVHGDR